MCVFYNQFTNNSRLIEALKQVFYFSIRITALEYWLEKKTRLVKYKKAWNWRYTLSSITGSFLIIRLLMFLIRKGSS